MLWEEERNLPNCSTPCHPRPDTDSQDRAFAEPTLCQHVLRLTECQEADAGELGRKTVTVGIAAPQSAERVTARQGGVNGVVSGAHGIETPSLIPSPTVVSGWERQRLSHVMHDRGEPPGEPGGRSGLG